ncbi:MAG: type II toxin-antitoxin system VapC family toxin [Candidatus Electrothrix aestuarii]|uniref:Ribonuclease VapC n=1 Tax=Candidatus Electrothrix aestuarii TaxID=3062594 RepID=A0AAU8LQM8_9BACT|nr:type II toxin-antitoxin system VapC family toxin [Candidatus Electrothrix aestuarii]
MSGILIDTNIYSEAMRGNAEVVATLRRVPHIGFSSISVGELLSGFKAGNREEKNRRELSAFLQSPRVMLFTVDEMTADQYSSVHYQLRKQGTPIPTNDIWIAAIALQHGLPIYTLDKHFRKVDGLIFHVSGH